MRWLLAALVLAGCASPTEKCNRARVAARDAWGAARRDARPFWEERWRTNQPGGQQWQLLDRAMGAARDAALGRAVAAHEAAERVETDVVRDLSGPHATEALEAVDRALAASAASWDRCRDVDP